jgi:hypothetical protein
MGVMPKGILSVHQWRGGELDWGDNVATQRARDCQRTLPRHTKGRLGPGLDSALSAPAARPAKRAARGPGSAAKSNTEHRQQHQQDATLHECCLNGSRV